MASQVILHLLICAALFGTGKSADAVLGDFPYMVAIQSIPDSTLICGGVLISDDVVLTAATCVYNLMSNYQHDRKTVTIMAGDLNVLKPAGSFTSNIVKVTVHEEFKNRNDGVNNIALVKLVTPIPAEFKLHNAFPIEIAENTATIGTSCKLPGWQNAESALTYYEVTVVSKNNCNSRLSGFTKSEDFMICTDGSVFHTSYQGILGGPLICNGKLAGIAPIYVWRPQSNEPGAFVDVTLYKTWIERNIFEGRLVGPNEYPYSAILEDRELENDNSWRYRCVGVLIDSDTILTSAECGDPSATTFSIIVGLTDMPQTALGEDVKEIIRHSEYDASSKRNNLALIKLHKSFPGAKFPSIDRVKTDNICTAIGWGAIPPGNYDQVANRDLLAVDLQRLSSSHSLSSGTKYPNMNVFSIIRVTDVNRKRNFCEWDYGGPLFCDGVLRGIYSYGDTCSKGYEYPTVYTDVADYTDWIRRNHNSSWNIAGNLLWIVIALLIVFKTV